MRGALVCAALTANTIACCLPLFVLAAVKPASRAPAHRRYLARGLTSIAEAWIAINTRILRLRRPGLMEVRGLEGLARNSWYLVIANHRSWSDVILLQAAFNRRIPFLRFFIKRELKWFPFLGIAFWALDMPFMTRYSKSYLAKHPEKKGQDLETAQAASVRFRDMPSAAINFVEGTRFTAEKQASRQSAYRHLLPPRSGGVASVLAGMGDRLTAILDVTIVYRGAEPGFWDLCRGTLGEVLIEVRPRAVESWMLDGDYARDRKYRSRFHRWLKDVWAEKDERIAATLGAHRPPAGPRGRRSGISQLRC